MDYIINLINLILIYFILTQSYNLVLGYTGMIHVGHIGFMAVGAYTSALLTLAGTPFWLGLLAGIVAAAFLGFLLGLPTIRLREDYLVAATLGLGEIIRLILLNERQFTGGSSGLTKIGRPEFFGFVFQSNFSLMLLLAVFSSFTLLLIHRFIHSPFGKALEAIREDEIAAQSLGINTRLRKLQILIIGSGLAGFSGALYAHTTQFIDPDMFGLTRMIFVFLIVVFGGTGKFWGPILGTVMLYSLYESMRFLPLPAHVLGPLRWILYSVILITIIIFRPKGVLGEKLRRVKL